MKFQRCLTICLAVLFIFTSFFNVYAQQNTQKRKPVVVPGKSFLPLRVLARPFSNVYKEADDKSGTVENGENVPVFQNYFVYTRPNVTVTGTHAEGWYEVGTDNRGTVLGWMKAEDVMEWKQTMCLAYEHPGGRKPVLMFEQLDALRELVKMLNDNRVKKANDFYQQIESKNLPKDFPIISMEPKDAIDINEQFYLLPILEHSEIEIEGREGRLLKLASAPKSGRGGGNLKNPEGGKTAAPTANPESAMLKKLTLDIVYVVDMTGSMGPYIQATLKAINDMSRLITQDSELAKSVNFGLWGYRDSTDISGIEFTTKNYTPKLQNVSDFEKTLSSVSVARVGSKDYPEDVFSGVDKAMRETEWNEEALHIMVLLGDAPSHQPGEKWNLSGQSADTLRTFADDNKYSLFALHIKDSQANSFWDLTEEQFKTLSRNRGLEGESSYYSVPSDDMVEFEKVSKTIAEELVGIVKMAKQGTIAVASTGSTGGASQPSSKGQDDVTSKVRKLGYAALVDWIGREKGAEAPRDIIAWVTDKDLIDPALPSLDVRVLINKKQLDSTKTVLQEIMAAGKRGLISGEDFFEALQAVPSVASRSGDQIRNAKSLAETNLIPEFMQGLPYKSQIMSMSNDMWASWSLDQQEEFLNELDAKIQLYVAIHDEPKSWVPLNKGDDADEHVYPLSLKALP